MPIFQGQVDVPRPGSVGKDFRKSDEASILHRLLVRGRIPQIGSRRERFLHMEIEEVCIRQVVGRVGIDTHDLALASGVDDAAGRRCELRLQRIILQQPDGPPAVGPIPNAQIDFRPRNPVRTGGLHFVLRRERCASRRSQSIHGTRRLTRSLAAPTSASGSRSRRCRTSRKPSRYSRRLRRIA